MRSLSTSFNLMKPLFVKAAALPALPLKPSRAQGLALKEQEGVPFPFAFAIQQAPKTNTAHTEIWHRLRLGHQHRDAKGRSWKCRGRGCGCDVGGSHRGWAEIGSAEEVTAGCKQSQENASGAAGHSWPEEGAGAGWGSLSEGFLVDTARARSSPHPSPVPSQLCRLRPSQTPRETGKTGKGKGWKQG